MKYYFCPNCGSRYPDPAFSANRKCGSCGQILYLNSKPTASTIIVRDGRLLLGRRRIEPAKGKWDIIGGFLDYGEHPDEGVIREAKEETGLDVRIVGRLGFFLDEYGADREATLNVCYATEVVGGEMKADDDIEELKWFDPGEIPEDIACESCNRRIEAWRQFSSGHGV